MADVAQEARWAAREWAHTNGYPTPPDGLLDTYGQALVAGHHTTTEQLAYAVIDACIARLHPEQRRALWDYLSARWGT